MSVIIQQRLPLIRMQPFTQLRQAATASVVALGVLASGWALVLGGELSLSVLALSSPSRVSPVAAITRVSSTLPLIQLDDAVRASSSETTVGLSLSVPAVTSIRDAREAVRVERECTVAECGAFEQFALCVGRLDPPAPPSDTFSHVQERPRMMNPNLTSSSKAATDDLDAVHRAYRETVMSMDHYEEEYDESMGVNMAAEFSDELAVAITNGSQFTPYLQQTVVQAANAAKTRRKEFIPRLDEEENMLEDAQQTLASVGEQFETLTTQPRYQRSVADLREARQQLTDCITSCEQLLDERQTQRVAGHTAEPHTDELVDLQHYLYRSLEVTYPVLAAGTTVLDRCVTARHRIEEDLTYRL